MADRHITPVPMNETGQIGEMPQPIDQQYLQDRTNQIRSDYAASITQIDDQFSKLASNIKQAQDGITQQINKNAAAGAASYNKMMTDFNSQITNIRNAQQVQVSATASQLDSMMASGQFGGNVYRAQQVYSMNMSNVISQSMSAIADITLQYRSSAENLKLQYNSQNLSAFISGATSILGATVEMAKSYAMITSEMNVQKNNQLNQIVELRAQMDMAERQLAVQKLIAERANEVQMLVTQWQIDADMKMTQWKIDLEDRQIAANERIAKWSNDTQIKIESMREAHNLEMQDLQSKLEINIRSSELDAQKYMERLRARTQLELGSIDNETKKWLARVESGLKERQIALEESQFAYSADAEQREFELKERQIALEESQFAYSADAEQREIEWSKMMASKKSAAIDLAAKAEADMLNSIIKAEEVAGNSYVTQMDMVRESVAKEMENVKKYAIVRLGSDSPIALELVNGSFEKVNIDE
jgi:stress-induced morphogen